MSQATKLTTVITLHSAAHYSTKHRCALIGGTCGNEMSGLLYISFLAKAPIWIQANCCAFNM